MVLLVRYPRGRAAERHYAAETVLHVFLGLAIEHRPEDRADVSISLIGDAEVRELTIADDFLATPDASWLSIESLPRLGVPSRPIPNDLLGGCFSAGNAIPVLYPRRVPDVLFQKDGAQSTLHLDVFGTVFLFLTRYEEIAISARDRLDRFPLDASLASREGLLRRPLVNEYVELLWNALRLLWPELQRRPTTYEAVLSHDVDALSVSELTPYELIRSVGADLVLRRDPKLAMRRSFSYVGGLLGGRPLPIDPYNTADFVMDVSECAGLRSVFNFVPDGANTKYDPRYRIAGRAARAMLRRIAARGHEIGFHGGFDAYRDDVTARAQYGHLRSVCLEEGIAQQEWGGRLHYLRWRNPETWRVWEACGLAYDSTIGFAEQPGFRAGTCWEYPAFDLTARRVLAVRERPLIAMESSMLSYMRLSLDDTAQLVIELSEVCRRYSGRFTLLWHGHMLASRESRQVYSEIVRRVA